MISDRVDDINWGLAHLHAAATTRMQNLLPEGKRTVTLIDECYTREERAHANRLIEERKELMKGVAPE
jgi:hypothetical protein